MSEDHEEAPQEPLGHHRTDGEAEYEQTASDLHVQFSIISDILGPSFVEPHAF